MTTTPPAVRQIHPDTIYPKTALIRDVLHCSKGTYDELVQDFGLTHVLGGGNTEFEYLGKMVLEALERRARREFVPRMDGPPKRKEMKRRGNRQDAEGGAS